MPERSKNTIHIEIANFATSVSLKADSPPKVREMA